MKKDYLIIVVLSLLIIFVLCGAFALNSVNVEKPKPKPSVTFVTESETESQPVVEKTEKPKPPVVETEAPETEAETVEETAEYAPIYYGKWSEYDIEIACHIVFGEAGNQGYYGKLLVAQCLLQGCLDNDCTPEECRYILAYAGYQDYYDEETKEAVVNVFANGVRAVEDDIKFFYAPALCEGGWHETQRFVIEYKDHRFFAEW